MSSSDGNLLFRGIPASLRLTTAEKNQLHLFLQDLTAQIAQGSGFCCLITNDRALQRLNRDYLGLDYPTDVLSFPNGASSPNLGDLAISIERAHAQATQFGHALTDEIRILMLHGLLHLMGMDHETDQGEMECAERKWRSAFKLPQTLIERVRA